MINKIVKMLILKEVILNKKIRRNYKRLNMEMDFENIFIFIILYNTIFFFLQFF